MSGVEVPRDRLSGTFSGWVIDAMLGIIIMDCAAVEVPKKILYCVRSARLLPAVVEG